VLPPAFSLCAPILLGLALHGRRRRVLHLQPVIDPTSAIRRSEPFRNDAFATERASLLEDDLAVTREMLVEGYAIAGVMEKISERAFALLEWLLAKIKAIELDQVEGAQHGGMVMTPIAREIEHRKPLPIDDDSLAVDDACCACKPARAAAIFGKRAVKS
jgi:hypothetical protein